MVSFGLELLSLLWCQVESGGRFEVVVSGRSRVGFGVNLGVVVWVGGVVVVVGWFCPLKAL